MKTTIAILLFVLATLPIPGFSQKTSKPQTHKALAATASSLNGKAVYTAHCLACHQADGSGVPNLNPPLIKTKWVMGSKAILIHQVLHGSQGKVEIDGDRFNNTMPPIPTLTDQEIADVLTYVRSHFKNKYSQVTVAEVRAERAKAK